MAEAIDSSVSPTTNPALFNSRSSEVVGACVTLLILPSLAVFLRLLSRWIARAGLWWDDYILILAMVLGWGCNISLLIASQHGLGKHVETLPIASISGWFKYLYAFEFCYSLSMLTFKFSVLANLYRIFPIVQFRRLCIGFVGFLTALTLACIPVSIWQCVPIHDFWDTFAGALHSQLGGRCVNVQLYFIVSGSINAFTDFVLLGAPLPLLWRLRTGLRQKILLSAIFVVGLTVCAVSVVRLVVLSEINEADVTWNYVTAATWTAAEPSIAVVSACLPSLRPLFMRVFQGGCYRRPSRRDHSTQKGLISSWRSGKNAKGNVDDSFNRLHENPSGRSPSPWMHNVEVSGGKAGSDSEDYEIGTRSGPPSRRIKVKTNVVVTISDRVDWQDGLF